MLNGAQRKDLRKKPTLLFLIDEEKVKLQLKIVLDKLTTLQKSVDEMKLLGIQVDVKITTSNFNLAIK